QEIDEIGGSDGFGFAFGAVVAEGAAEAAALFPLGGTDLVESLVLGRLEIGMFDTEAVVNHAIGDGVVVFGHDFERMAGFGIVNIVPEDGGMVTLDEFAHMGIGIFPVGFGLRLDGLIV